MNIQGEYEFNPYLERSIEDRVRLVLYDNKNKLFVHYRIIDSYENYYMPYSELDSHMDYKYKYQLDSGNKDQIKWVDHDKGYTYLIPEIVEETGLKYVFYPSVEPSDYLVVCFQAIQENPSYNYIRTLNNINVNRLYIKDGYGKDKKTHSSYYLNENNTIEVDTLVQNLVNKFVVMLNIDKKNTIFIGSSKGGFAGIYHGYKYGAGYIVVGGPQTLLGDYLCIDSENSIRPAIFKGIFREKSEANKKYANNLIRNVLLSSTSPYPNTFIHVGKEEPHYLEHAVPFMNLVKELNIKNVSWDLADYSVHEDLAKYYPPFLKLIIVKIIEKMV